VNRLIVIIFSVLCNGVFFAQDVHWSQYFDNSIFINPANSGNFIGLSRAHLQYKDQWRSVTKPFQTFSITYDTRLKKNEAIGLGFVLINDVVGDGKFRTIELQAAPSYTYKLKADSSRVLRFGLQLAFNHRVFDFSKFYFDEQYNQVAFDPNAPITEDLSTERKTTFSLGSGVAYSHKIDAKKNIRFGFSSFNMNQPNQGFYGQKIRRDFRIVGTIASDILLKTNFTLMPSLIYQRQGKFNEFIVGARMKQAIPDQLRRNIALYYGTYFRNKDAFYVHMGMDYKNYYGGISYDFNVSTLKPASSLRGGFEFVLRYIYNPFRPKKIQRKICPEFI
jgi:type IX secretion system PorP/SprF family membrane protein